MREILFRGKRIDNGEWVEGYYVHTRRHHCIITGCIDDGYVVHGHYANDVAMEVVDPATVGQYTGLTDKNGKKIFDGDIIRFRKFRDEPNWVGVVKYEICSYIAKGWMPLAYEKRKGEKLSFGGFEVQILGIEKTTIEVIGNIHDNPELLREEDDT